MAVFENILLMILELGGTAFILFLLGYAGYSIIKRGKKKRLREQERYDKLEVERMERYIRSMDNDLKSEIDAAIRKHNKQNGIEDTYNEKNTNDFATDLTEKIKYVMEKGIMNKILYKMEKKYQKYNEKYDFDKDGKLFENVKNTLQTGVDKAISNLDKWAEKNDEKFEKWK